MQFKDQSKFYNQYVYIPVYWHFVAQFLHLLTQRLQSADKLIAKFAVSNIIRIISSSSTGVFCCSAKSYVKGMGTPT